MKQVREPYHSLARLIKKNLARTSLITFNYDNLLEQALTKLGVSCNYGIDMEVKRSSIRIYREDESLDSLVPLLAHLHAVLRERISGTQLCRRVVSEEERPQTRYPLAPHSVVS